MLKLLWLDDLDDISAMAELENVHRHAWRRVVENLGGYNEGYETDTSIWGRETTARAVAAGGRVLLAYKDSVLVGSVIATHETHKGEPALRINRLVVLPEYRREHIGKAMLEHCESLYRKQGCKWAFLFTAAKLTHLVAYYQSMGYVEWKRELVHMYSQSYDRVFLEKPL
jgi:ribosomal protein S18 acetylase RimI-like enzyme